MVTAAQLAESQAYERRRVVTAFVTGEQPERVAEQPSAVRAVLAGTGVAALVLAADLVAAVLRL